MEAIRRSCIELVESVDKVCRMAATRGQPEHHTAFEQVTVQAMQQLAAIPAIHRLRGRVREASDAEILKAMTFMATFATEVDGVNIVRGLEHAALESEQPEVAAKLRKLQAQMVKDRSNPSAN